MTQAQWRIIVIVSWFTVAIQGALLGLSLWSDYTTERAGVDVAAIVAQIEAEHR